MVRLINRAGAQKDLPETIIFKRVPLSINLPYQTLPGKSGAILTGEPTIEPRQFSLEGRVYYKDKDRIEQELDALLSFLMQPPIEVYRLEHHNRFLLAYPLGAPQDWIDLGAELAISIPMIALNPFWQGQEVEKIVTDTQIIEVEGTAPTIPFIKTTGSVSGLTVSNSSTGKEIVVSDVGVIEVDSEDFVVTADGVNCLDKVNDDWKLHGFELLPGTNTITTNTPVTMVYRPRWY